MEKFQFFLQLCCPLHLSYIITNIFVIVDRKTYSNHFPFMSRILFTTICKPFEKICIRSNDLVTCSLETPTRSNDLATRSLETPTHSNDLVTRSLETLTNSNDLVSRSLETATHSNNLTTRLLETPTRSNDLTTRSLETATRSNKLVTCSQTPTCWIKYMTVIISRDRSYFLFRVFTSVDRDHFLCFIKYHSIF